MYKNAWSASHATCGPELKSRIHGPDVGGIVAFLFLLEEYTAQVYGSAPISKNKNARMMCFCSRPIQYI
jgi:hypothetical protein